MYRRARTWWKRRRLADSNSTRLVCRCLGRCVVSECLRWRVRRSLRTGVKVVGRRVYLGGPQIDIKQAHGEPRSLEDLWEPRYTSSGATTGSPPLFPPVLRRVTALRRSCTVKGFEYAATCTFDICNALWTIVDGKKPVLAKLRQRQLKKIILQCLPTWKNMCESIEKIFSTKSFIIDKYGIFISMELEYIRRNRAGQNFEYVGTCLVFQVQVLQAQSTWNTLKSRVLRVLFF